MQKASLFICLLGAVAFTSYVNGQAPKQFLEMLPPSPKTKVVTIHYINSFDGSSNEALLEIPPSANKRVPLIVTPNPAGWPQETNRSIWSGVADQFNVMILYPKGEGAPNPDVTIGSDKRIGSLESAIAAVEKSYKVDKSRVYAAGESQGAIETLLLVGIYPEQFAGALSLNPATDFIALYQDFHDFLAHPPQGTIDPLSKLRLKQWAVLEELFELSMGGTPDTARAA